MSDLWSGRDGSGDATGRDGDGAAESDALWSGRPEPTEKRRGWRRGSSRPKGVNPRTRTTARVLLAVIVVGGLGLGGAVGTDLLSVRSSLQEARGAVSEARSALGSVDLAATRSALDVAIAEIEDAERRADRFTWSIMARAPYVGPSIEVTREVVEVGAAAVEVADIGVAEGSALLTDGLDVLLVDGRIDLGPLAEARALIEQLPTARLTAARDALREPTDGWLPEEVLTGREDTLAQADELVEALERTEALTAALPGFLGADGPKRYFVGFQTSAELRGTGGLIGYWAVLQVDDGAITFGAGEDYDPFDDAVVPEGETRVDRIRSIGLSPVNPPDADPRYLARYDVVSGARSFPNINLDPDLPTTAKAILDLYELQVGAPLDGVVLLDPPGLERLLRATSASLPLPEEVAAATGYEDGLPPDDFARFVTDEIYEVYGFDASDERNDLLRQLGDAAFTQVVGGGWNGPDMVAAVAEAATERHLQIHSLDAEVQDALDAVNVTGSLQPRDGADLLALTANNVVGGKQDVHLGHELSLDLTIDRLRQDDDGAWSARRHGTASFAVENPLPTSGRDLYVLGSCYVPDGRNRCFEGDPGTNRTWFSFWAPPGTSIGEVTADDGQPPTTRVSSFRELRVVDQFLLTPSQERSSATLELVGDVALTREQTALVYELDLWRQAKAIPDLVEVRITPPQGWAVGDIEVVGGGTGRGMGVHGDGVELTAEVRDGVGVLSGTTTADTRVRVRLTDPARL